MLALFLLADNARFGGICRAGDCCFVRGVSPCCGFLTFIVLQLTLFGINMLGVVQQVLPWTALLARGCAALVTLFDASAAAAGKVLWNTVSGFGVSIEPGCNGIEACIVLFAAVIAFPSTWRHKLVGLAAGFVAVQGLNVVRVISLFLPGAVEYPSVQLCARVPVAGAHHAGRVGGSGCCGCVRAASPRSSGPPAPPEDPLRPGALRSLAKACRSAGEHVFGPDASSAMSRRQRNNGLPWVGLSP